MNSDSDAYVKFAHHRKWFNKLWFSESMNYNCGPAGIKPLEKGYYIVRPIMNISGMSVGAEKVFLDTEGSHKTPPGYFWCEFFTGRQFSVTYENVNNNWIIKSCWQGYKNDSNLSKFVKWERCSHLREHENLPNLFAELNDLKTINVEFIEDKPIEVHLRSSPDPEYDILIPIWENEKYLIDKYKKMNYKIIYSYDDADGNLDVARIAFAVKNDKKE